MEHPGGVPNAAHEEPLPEEHTPRSDAFRSSQGAEPHARRSRRTHALVAHLKPTLCLCRGDFLALVTEAAQPLQKEPLEPRGSMGAAGRHQ